MAWLETQVSLRPEASEMISVGDRSPRIKVAKVEHNPVKGHPTESHGKVFSGMGFGGMDASIEVYEAVYTLLGSGINPTSRPPKPILGTA